MPVSRNSKAWTVLFCALSAVALLYEVRLDLPAGWSLSVRDASLVGTTLEKCLLVLACAGLGLSLLGSARLIKVPYWAALSLGVANGLLLATVMARAYLN